MLRFRATAFNRIRYLRTSNQRARSQHFMKLTGGAPDRGSLLWRRGGAARGLSLREAAALPPAAALSRGGPRGPLLPPEALMIACRRSLLGDAVNGAAKFLRRPGRRRGLARKPWRRRRRDRRRGFPDQAAPSARGPDPPRHGARLPISRGRAAGFPGLRRPG